MLAPHVGPICGRGDEEGSVVMIYLLKSQIAELMKIKSISCPFLLIL